MSLVGTRPILQDELRQYELHHRARIAIKPGMSFEKDTFKNPSNEKPKTMDFSLQSNATKPLDMNRMLGKPSEEKAADTTNNVTTAQEGN